jgi:toxin FitB
MFLLDTNIISELRRKKPHGAVVAWLKTVNDADLHISAATIGEIQAGIEITREQDVEKAKEIEAWLENICSTYSIIPLDLHCFRQYARIMHHRTDDIIDDALIAATAHIHNLTVVTRNTRDFIPLSVKVLNPFE